MTLCNASCGRINFIPPTGWGQPNRDPGSPLLSFSFALSVPKRDCFQSIYMHLSQLPPLAGSGDKSFHNKLKWKCRREKGPRLAKGTYQHGLPGQNCTRSLTHHVPSLTTEIQTCCITTTVQLNSMKFSLGECRRYTFKPKYIRCCLAGRTSLMQTVGALSAQGGCSALTTLAQDSRPLARGRTSLSPRLLWWPLDHRLVLSPSRPCSDVWDGTLPTRALPCRAGVSSAAGSFLGQPHSSCSPAQTCCFQISITAWVNKQ